MSSDPHVAADRRRVLRYYDSAGVRRDYGWFLGDGGMHFGYTSNPRRRLVVHQLRAAGRAMTAMVAQSAAIRPGDRVLDAGCGVGWAALAVARMCQCHVTGISISAAHVRDATSNARSRGVSRTESTQGWAEFALADYTALQFPDETFDVVYFMDSACHDAGLEKRASMREAFRVLKPGGRLVVADGFSAKTDLPPAKRALMDSWLLGWAVDELADPVLFERSLRTIGFDSVVGVDETEHVLPFAKGLHDLAVMLLPGEWLLRRLGLRSSVEHRNVIAARDQYRALRLGLWRYFLFTAVKPRVA